MSNLVYTQLHLQGLLSDDFIIRNVTWISLGGIELGVIVPYAAHCQTTTSITPSSLKAYVLESLNPQHPK
jgi:hypothetical protein